MKHKLWYDEENQVLREQIIGSLTEEEIPEFLARVDDLFKGKKNCHAIIDLSQASSQIYSRKARKKLAEGSIRLGYSEKVAFIGADYRVRMFARVLIAGAKVLGKPIKSQFFDNEKEALVWLKEKPEKKTPEAE
jgi:hypothetical protein